MKFPILHDPDLLENDRSWITRVPILGWQIGFSRQCRNEQRLVQQAIDRGKVPDEEWDGLVYDPEIRATLERIVIDRAYPKGSSFHPNDPFELMIVLRYGDLNEWEILMDIEDRYGVKVNDEEFLKWLIDDKVTFIQFIQFVHANRSKYVNV